MNVMSLVYLCLMHLIGRITCNDWYSLDYYGILGVKPDATTKTIKRKFRLLSIKWDPAINERNMDEAILASQRIKEVYQVLTHTDYRKLYDALFLGDDSIAEELINELDPVPILLRQKELNKTAPYVDLFRDLIGVTLCMNYKLRTNLRRMEFMPYIR
uniref:Putative dnaj molecular chaperone logy domain protein n=1 Tax=Ixodes ricinus TaxID=34613 RepID=A0A0K8R3F9_IXORI